MCNTEQQKEKIAEWMFQAIREYYMKKCTFPNDKLHHPELAGKPMAVGGDPEARHGIVLTANYIAKRAGIKTGMALWQARQVCPEIIFVPPRMDLYLRFSRMAQEIYSEYTDQRGFMYQDKILAQLNAKEHMIHPQAYFHG